MKLTRFNSLRIFLIINVLIISSLSGCPSVSQQVAGFQENLGPSGVVEMDQNTDPRFFLPQERGRIGRLKIAGDEVFLNDVPVNRDVDINNGDHVATGDASWAVIEFSRVWSQACRIETRNLLRGRIYGIVRKCGHFVTAYQSAMETMQGTESYHVQIVSENEIVFTAIQGPIKVWLQFDPSYFQEVPSYHQVTVSDGQISPPENVKGEIGRITGWRDNFRRLRGQMIQVPDLRNMPLMEAKDTLNRLSLQIDAPNADRRILSARSRRQELVVYSQSPQPGAWAMQNDRVTVNVQADALPVYVPDLIKMTIMEAEKNLSSLGLRMDANPENAAGRDRVYRQSPSPGRKVNKGDEVRVYVRADPRTKEVRVPDLRKRTLGEAERRLKRLGLRIDVNPSNAKTESRVISQKPNPGSRVVPNSKVEVTVDVPVRGIIKLPEVMTVPTQLIQWVTVPDLQNPSPKSLAECRTILGRLGLGLRYSPRNATGEYWVVKQSPAAGRRVKKGTVVDLTLQPPIY